MEGFYEKMIPQWYKPIESDFDVDFHFILQWGNKGESGIESPSCDPDGTLIVGRK